MDARWIRCVFNENARREYPDAVAHLSVPAWGWNPLTSPLRKGYTGWVDGANMYSQYSDRGEPFRYGLYRVMQIIDERYEPCRVEDLATGETFDAACCREENVFLRCRHEKLRKNLDPLMDGVKEADPSKYRVLPENDQ